jgi:hypothetical protein
VGKPTGPTVQEEEEEEEEEETACFQTLTVHKFTSHLAVRC